jgi:membrane protein
LSFLSKKTGKSLRRRAVDLSMIRFPNLAGSLAYYMVFSMGPLPLIIITLCSYFFGRAAVVGWVDAQLRGFVGQDTAAQLQQIIKNASMNGKTVLASAIHIQSFVWCDVFN